jgi:hypothetical protein
LNEAAIISPTPKESIEKKEKVPEKASSKAKTKNENIAK